MTKSLKEKTDTIRGMLALTNIAGWRGTVDAIKKGEIG